MCNEPGFTPLTLLVKCTQGTSVSAATYRDCSLFSLPAHIRSVKDKNILVEVHQFSKQYGVLTQIHVSPQDHSVYASTPKFIHCLLKISLMYTHVVKIATISNNQYLYTHHILKNDFVMFHRTIALVTMYTVRILPCGQQYLSTW